MILVRMGNSANEIRRETRRRLIVGLSGVVSMLLLVLLAGWLTGATRQQLELTKAQAEAAGVPNPGAIPGEREGGPLADLGAARAVEAGDQPAVPRPVPPMPTAKGNAMTVPDLQPDPQIENPKARR